MIAVGVALESRRQRKPTFRSQRGKLRTEPGKKLQLRRQLWFPGAAHRPWLCRAKATEWVFRSVCRKEDQGAPFFSLAQSMFCLALSEWVKLVELGLTLYDTKNFDTEAVSRFALLEVVLLSLDSQKPADLWHFSWISNLDEHNVIFNRLKNTVYEGSLLQTGWSKTFACAFLGLEGHQQQVTLWLVNVWY